MTAYDNDPRVAWIDGGFDVGRVTALEPSWRVEWRRDGNWYDIASLDPGAGYINNTFNTGNEAVHWLIGDPQ